MLREARAEENDQRSNSGEWQKTDGQSGKLARNREEENDEKDVGRVEGTEIVELDAEIVEWGTAEVDKAIFEKRSVCLDIYRKTV